jgi:hypothetical protein
MIIASHYELICLYLLVGTIIGFLMEEMFRCVDEDVSGIERFWLVTLWPLMILIFIYYLLVGIFDSND